MEENNIVPRSVDQGIAAPPEASHRKSGTVNDDAIPFPHPALLFEAHARLMVVTYSLSCN